MGAGVATVGRRAYAVGLYWENSPSGRVAQTAKDAANQPGQQADFYAVRGGNKDGRVPQFGLGQAAAGHKAGMPAFAGCLANQQPGSWAGAFRMREGVVVTVVRDDLIVPDGDQFFFNESDARDRLLQEVGFGGLQRIYAPESWAIPGSDTMPISLLLDERRDIVLRPVAISKKTLVFGAAAAAILLLGFVIVWYIHSKDAEERALRDAADALARAQRAAQTPFSGEQPKYPPPERKWEKLPPPMAVIEACHVGLSQVGYAVAGWKLTQLTCSGKSISLSWVREKGFSRPPQGSVVSENGGSASVSIALPSLTARGPEDLVDPTEVMRRYLAQDWPGALARAPDDPMPPPPPDFQGQWTPPPPPWVKRSFTVSVPELPADLSLFFGDLPGTTVNSLSYAPNGGKGGNWTIEGVIYENRV
jgi:hypothetical protein